MGNQLYIPKRAVLSRLSKEEIDELPKIIPDEPVFCEHCGEQGAENHHWSPRQVFGDEADEWPQSPLCVSCHNRWHRMIEDFYIKEAYARQR